ncbi:MAG: beta-ketoacyl-[acyl-carrier-protein] synthase family protein [Planctomycetota bacterium]
MVASNARTDRERVVVTGTGWVTPLGCDVDSVWTKLLAGASGIAPVRRFDAGTWSTSFAAQVPHREGAASGDGFELFDFMDEAATAHARAGLSTRFALAAAAQAWVQAGLGEKTGRRTAELDPDRLGVYLGAGEGSLDYPNYIAANLAAWFGGDGTTADAASFARTGLERLTAAREVEQEPHLTVSHLAEAFDARGPSLNCMTACAASTQAVGEATEIIRRGDADVMLAGGAHSMIHILGMTGFSRLTAMSTRRDDPATASRPFDKTRDGFVMGEGAGVVVLESLESARRRGATVLAEIVGFGSSADAYRITDIDPEGFGAVKAMRQALEQAGIDPTKNGPDGRPSVHYVSAHGTGTQENDGLETKAVRQVFGELAPSVPFASLKSMTGHLIQAAGAVELIACIQSIRTGFIPPTVNLNTPDPECDLDHVPNAARDRRDDGGVEVCLSNSFGFGGQNDTVCVRRYEG